MKNKFLLIILGIFLLINALHAQSNNQQQNASQSKDAPVDVSISDFKKNLLVHEIVVFRSQLNQKEYQGLSQEDGKFSLRLPAGDKYDIFILGFKDSVSNITLEIPALGPNESYKTAQKVDLYHQPAKTFVLDDVNFETGKAELKIESFPVLDELVAYLNRKDDERIEIGGHTDNVGKPAANILLSMERAKSVMAYVISKGIYASRLTAKGYGSSIPVASNATSVGKAMNRRTEIKILE
jgi:outer membrane protein OmpA-like peptidoglycan-associated protein